MDDLHEGVLRLGAISSSISSELKEHDTLLDEIEDGVERAHSGMEYVTARTKSIIETACACHCSHGAPGRCARGR